MHLRITLFNLLLFFLLVSCKSENIGPNGPDDDDKNGNTDEYNFVCEIKSEEDGYKTYPLGPDNVPVGDVMPYYDTVSGTFYIHYLFDVWNDNTNVRHPWYGFGTDDYVNFTELPAGELIGTSSNACDQDYAIGTGSVIEKDGTYYAFYTGHNPTSPSNCINTKEGVMLATSTSLSNAFNKRSDFKTLFAPINLPFDHNDNFRDPYVYLNTESKKYSMIVSARKNHNGEWRGVIAHFVSEDLMNWNYEGVLFDGGDTNYFMMETPELFKLGEVYYLLYSDTGSRHVHYRKSSSINGPWEKPEGEERFAGVGIYAAKSTSDGIKRYLSAWTHRKQGESDFGDPLWGGNLITHEIYQTTNGDLALKIPESINSHYSSNELQIKSYEVEGSVEVIDTLEHSYNLSANNDGFASIAFRPIDNERYQINTSLTFTSGSEEFGLILGGCDAENEFYSLRFLPDKGMVSLEIKNRENIDDSVAPYNDVPLELDPNTSYEVKVIIENSMVVVYVDDKIALSSRVYKAMGNLWGIYSENGSVFIENIKVSTP